MSEHDIAVAVSGVSRMFKRYRHPRHRVMEALGLPLPKKAFDEFWALRDISFEVKRGDSLAIIGQNGAGKSTLLSIVCGRLQPSSGTVTVRGGIQALMDLGTGFHPEFTGVQNIYSALAYQGITGAEAARRYEEIVEFSELDEFIDQPIKTYSTGMYARLAFSTATAIQPDVLVIDEILSAGDAYFASKCADRMRRLTREVGATVLFVSHDISSVQRLCEHAVWLERGRIKMAGPTLDISKAYYAFVTEREEARLRAATSRAVSRMRLQEHTANSGREEEQLLFRLVRADGGLPSQSHPVCRIALFLADGRRLEVLPGEPMDNDDSQPAYIRSDPGYMLWDLPVTVRGRAVRCVTNTSGIYCHAPIFFRASMEMLGAQGAIEIEHAAVAGEAIAVEIYEPGGYRRLGLLTPAPDPDGWQIDRLTIASPAAMTGPDNALTGCSTGGRVTDTALGAALESSGAVGDRGPREKWETIEARFVDVTVCNDASIPQHTFKFGQAINFKITIETRVAIPQCWLALIIYDERGNRILLAVHHFQNEFEVGKYELLSRISQPNLRQGEYIVTLELLPEFDLIWQGQTRMPYLCHWDRCVFFKIDEDYHGLIELGIVSLPMTVEARPLFEFEALDGIAS